MTHASTLVLFATALLAGCASTTPQFDQRFGQATRAANAAQILDPGAAIRHAGRTPVGLEAGAARAAMERYTRSFAAGESAPKAGGLNFSGAQDAK